MWSKRNSDVEVHGEPLPHPHQDLDGWTLAGTELRELRGPTAREMAVLLHSIDLHVDTPWTYQRAADMLESEGHPEMALTALDLWLSHPHAADQPERTREIQRQRIKVQERLARSVAQARRR